MAYVKLLVCIFLAKSGYSSDVCEMKEPQPASYATSKGEIGYCRLGEGLTPIITDEDKTYVAWSTIAESWILDTYCAHCGKCEKLEEKGTFTIISPEGKTREIRIDGGACFFPNNHTYTKTNDDVKLPE
jgi:hypothetical protein